MEDFKTTKQDSEPKGWIKAKYNRVLELYIWLIAALLILLPSILFSIENRFSWYFFIDFYYQFILAFLLFMIPTLFRLIFGKLPFEYLRVKRDMARGINVQDSNSVHTVIDDLKSKTEQSVTFMNQYINESKLISEKIFTRSGVYLLIGCLIASIGITIFFSPIFPDSQSNEINQRLMDYLPRFGSLFFIEFIALFFLKQYRIMLEEYRYYEAIKRKRQDNYSLIELIKEYKENEELLKIMTDHISSSSITKLSNGETTEILETQKIVNNDLDVFARLTELIKEVKK